MISLTEVLQRVLFSVINLTVIQKISSMEMRHILLMTSIIKDLVNLQNMLQLLMKQVVCNNLNKVIHLQMLSREVQTEMTQTLKKNVQSVSQDFVLHYTSKRIITEVDQITKLFEKNCQEDGCNGHCSVVNIKCEGGVLGISCKCLQGHCGVWEPSCLDRSSGSISNCCWQ